MTAPQTNPTWPIYKGIFIFKFSGRMIKHTFYLTISRQRRGDYKPIFTEPRSGEVNIGCNHRAWGD